MCFSTEFLSHTSFTLKRENKEIKDEKKKTRTVGRSVGVVVAWGCSRDHLGSNTAFQSGRRYSKAASDGSGNSAKSM